jgi:hypothetical protein
MAPAERGLTDRSGRARHLFAWFVILLADGVVGWAGGTTGAVGWAGTTGVAGWAGTDVEVPEVAGAVLECECARARPSTTRTTAMAVPTTTAQMPNQDGPPGCWPGACW